jgi:hypothetical protein
MLWHLLWFDWGASVGKRTMINNFSHYGKSVYKNKVYHCNKIETVLENEDEK